jgi:hypothetical protein
MKTKKIREKLNLKKITVSNLDHLAMKGVQGGVDLSDVSYCLGCNTADTCNTCYTCAPITCGKTLHKTFLTCDPLMCASNPPYQC